MSDLAKREENGRKGEARTEGFLLDAFWVLRRSADIDGADFLVQEQSDTLEELRERTKKLEVLGIVQSKFFENRNEVAVAAEYVFDSDGPRFEFFLSVHTDDKDGRHQDYFFTAEQICKEIHYRASDDKPKVFFFSITKERKFEDYCNLTPRKKNGLIREGMMRASATRNAELLQMALVVAKQHLASYQSGLAKTQPDEFELRRGSLAYIFNRDGLTTRGRVFDLMTETSKTLPAPPVDMEKHEFDPVTETWRVKQAGE